MRSLLAMSLVVAMLSGPALSVPAAPASVAGRGTTDADEAKVEKLIEQMGAASYARREDAHKQLKAMGAAVVPVLVRCRDHMNPEVRERVRQIIAGHKWITRGAIVLSIVPGSQAERLGFKPGDVVVKVNDTDITGNRDLRPTLRIEERTYYIWRGDKIITHRVEPGLVGYRCSTWDYAKGGSNQSRGIAALAGERHAEAYRRLSAALREGMEDTHCLAVLCGLAAHELDHKRAMELYTKLQQRPGGTTGWSRISLRKKYRGLPMTGPHSAYLVDRLKKERFSPQLWYQLDIYCVFQGRNLPLARKTTAKVWPKVARASRGQLFWHLRAKAKIALYDRRWDDVIKLYRRSIGTGYWTDQFYHVALRAALYQQDVPLACRIGARLLAGHKEGWASTHYASFALYAVAAAYAAGRDDLASPLLEALAKLPPEKRNAVGGALANNSWSHIAVGPQLMPFMEQYFAGRGVRYLNYARLNALMRSPGCTLRRWRESFSVWGDEEHQRYFHWLNAAFLLRAGEYDQAGKAVAKFAPVRTGVPAFEKARNFLSAHAARLEKDWSELKGVLQMYDASKAGCYWAVRYDGRCFYLDADGKIREYPGLAPGQTHRSTSGDSIFVHPNGTIYARRNQIYLFDEAAERWLPTYASPCRSPTLEPYWSDPTGPVVLRHVLEEYPTTGPGQGMWRRVAGPGGWLYYEFDGDFVLIVHPETLKLIDLSRAIARAAGRDGRVAVYRVRRVDDKKKVLIPTNVGLWTADAEGRLSRVELGLKDPNVYVSVLNWPKRKGKVYVGVAPQQGGQIVELDVATLAHRLTGGFCGVGPKDSFFNIPNFPRRIFCEYAIQAIYEKRLAAEAKAKGK